MIDSGEDVPGPSPQSQTVAETEVRPLSTWIYCTSHLLGASLLGAKWFSRQWKCNLILQDEREMEGGHSQN